MKNNLSVIRRLWLVAALLCVSLLSEAAVSASDSLPSLRTVYKSTLSDPDNALAVIQTMRQQGLAPEWQLDMAEGDVYFDNRRYLKALACYKRVEDVREVDDSNRVQLALLRNLMECYDKLNYSDALTETILRLRKKAQVCGDKAYEAISFFTSGRRMHFHGRKFDGYSSCLKAVSMMKESGSPLQHEELSDFYAELVKMYVKDELYDEAVRMSQLQEEEARQISSADKPGAVERDLRRVYALRACLLAKAGRMAEADKAYGAWKETAFGNVVDDMEVFDYLRLRQIDHEAMDIAMRYREFLRSQGDTISYRMLSVLNKEAQLHIHLGEYEKAAEHVREISTITDSIYRHVSRNVMTTTYELYHEQDQSHRKTLWLSLLSLGLVMLLFISAAVAYYLRIIQKKNRHLLHLLNGVDAYRRAVISGQPVSSEMADALDDIHSSLMEENPDDEGVGEPDDEDRRLFVEMDTQVTRDRLFLKPGLGRDDLMRLIGVDKNRFGKMMSKYSDASNTSVYINVKRVEYGASLLVEHPEYTIATIAAECGMSNTVTFNRTFKEMYNITPSEYRQRMGALLDEVGEYAVSKQEKNGKTQKEAEKSEKIA